MLMNQLNSIIIEGMVTEKPVIIKDREVTRFVIENIKTVDNKAKVIASITLEIKRNERYKESIDHLKKGMKVRAYGKIMFDPLGFGLIINAENIEIKPTRG